MWKFLFRNCGWYLNEKEAKLITLHISGLYITISSDLLKFLSLPDTRIFQKGILVLFSERFTNKVIFINNRVAVGWKNQYFRRNYEFFIQMCNLVFGIRYSRIDPCFSFFFTRIKYFVEKRMLFNSINITRWNRLSCLLLNFSFLILSFFRY